MAIIPAIISPSLRCHLGNWGVLLGAQVSWDVWMVRQTSRLIHVHVLVAPPSALSAWSMALVLWLPVKYLLLFINEPVYQVSLSEDLL